MQKYHESVLTTTGTPAVGVSVLVSLLDGSTATIYSDNGVTEVLNPLTTNSLGYFEFYAADGRYTLNLSGTGIVDTTITDVLLEDPVDGSSALADPSGSSLVGFIQAGTGAVARTVQDKLRERVSVLDFGADVSGLTSSLAAFTAAYDAVQAGGRIRVPHGNYSGVSGVLTSTKFVIWEIEGNPNGGGLWNLPGLIKQGFTNREITAVQQTVADGDLKNSFVRTTSHSGGTPGFVCTNMTVSTTAGAGVTNFEWSFLSILNNNAAAGENVAGYFQGNKNSTGPTWAAVHEAIDKTNLADPISGLVACEVDVRANGTDANNNRIGTHYVAAQGMTGGGNVACDAYAAIVVDGRNVAGDVGNFNYGMVVKSAKAAGIRMQQTGLYGIDTSAATFNDASNLNVAVRMAAGQKINFHSTLGRNLRYEPAVTALRYTAGTTTLFELADDGTVRCFGQININGTKVVGSRDTGWVAMTGTSNKNTAYDTASVTLPQLAGRVMALQAILTTHGLIGA